MNARRILLVDDHREMSRMLRTSLELLNRNYIIRDVPSGEEAMLEIGRAGVDLLIADVRLPGMSGLELLARLRARNTPAPTIVIAGSPTPEIEARARELQAHAFFAKPLKTEDFLRAVQVALGEEVETPAVLVESQAERPGMSQRLSTLRQDLNALAVLLVSDNGQVLARAGDVAGLNLDAIIPPLMAVFSAGVKICMSLNARLPTNFQFFDGGDYDIYTVNVGMLFGLVVVFQGETGVDQFASVARYCRPAADDLLDSLALLGLAPDSGNRGLANLPGVEPPAPPGASVPQPAPEAAGPEADDLFANLDYLAPTLKDVDTDTFWEQAARQADPAALRPEALTFEQARQLGLVRLPG